MATTEAVLTATGKSLPGQASATTGMVVAVGLTALSAVIHGYHPYAEDGGVYLAGIERLLDAGLYPSWSGFVTAHLDFSLFAPAVALITGASHLRLTMVVFALYLLSTWLTLIAGWMIVERCRVSRMACVGAVTLLALTLTMPVAGTSLMLMDPYVTARSLSTPLGLMALAGALEARVAILQGSVPPWRTLLLCALPILVAGAIHPLMAAYSLGFILMLVSVSLPGRKAPISAAVALCACAVILAQCLAELSPSAGSTYAQVAHTRRYWFVGTWRWYEQLGLIGPLVVLGAVAWRTRRQRSGPTWFALAATSGAAGSVAVVIAALDARWNAANFVVAMLQPLRIYQTIYAIMILAIGALLVDVVLKRSVARWAALMVVLGGGMGWVQERTFPHSAHLEVPWIAPDNRWEQAFVWVREHTSKNAIVAVDANYISVAGEDGQNFRAIAERSALPDYSKDGGIASIAPALSGEWLKGERAQENLDLAVGQPALARLRSLGAEWIVIPAKTPTPAHCEYANGEVKVCSIPS